MSFWTHVMVVKLKSGLSGALFYKITKLLINLFLLMLLVFVDILQVI